MNEPVAVPVQPSTDQPKSRPTPQSEGQMTDEGLDLSGYRGTHDSPYVADYLGLRDLYKTNQEVASQVDSLTKHLIDKTPNMSMVFVVKQLLDEMSQEMNLKDNDAGLYKLKKIHRLIEMKTRLNNLEELRQQVINDIEKV